MRVSEKELKEYPDGTIFSIFLSGDEWDEEFGNAYEVLKYKNKLLVLTDWFDMDINDKGYEIEVAYDPHSNKLFLSD